MKTYKYDELLKKKLKDPKFKKEYNALEEEFAIAAEVIKLRLKANLTQKELAEKVKTSQPAIARLESGNYKNISLVFLKKIAKALGAETIIHLRKVS